MTTFVVDVQIAAPFVECLSTESLEHLVHAVLATERQPDGTEVTLVITDDEHIRELNRTFRGIDSATDVLSFPAGEGDEFVIPDEAEHYVGDVVVSFPTALAQAAEQGHSLEDELALLTVHGTLHLLGYDHATDQQQAVMWARQDEILRALR